MPTYLKVCYPAEGPAGPDGIPHDLDNNNDEDWPMSGEAFGLSHDWWILIEKFGFEWSDPKADELNSAAEIRRRERMMSRRRAPKMRADEGGAGSGAQTGVLSNFNTHQERLADRQSGEKLMTFSKKGNTSSPQIVDWMTQGEVYDMRIEVCAENDEMLLRVDVLRAVVKEFRTSLSNSGGEVDDTMVQDEFKVVYQELRIVSAVDDGDGEAQPVPAVLSQGSGGSMAAADGGSAGSTGGAESGPPSCNVGSWGGTGAAATIAASGRAAAGVLGSEEKTELEKIDDRCLTADPVSGTEFELLSFEGVEEMSRPFEFYLQLASLDLAVDAKSMLGQPIAFRVEDSKENEDDGREPVKPREFHGVIREFWSETLSDDVREYGAVVVPALWFLQQRTDCRIFQKMTPLEIIKDVFTRIGFSENTEYIATDVKAQYPTLEYCVQYRESDFNFVHRLMEEFGIFYFFRFSAGAHQMVMADKGHAHIDCQRAELIQGYGDVEEDQKVTAWDRRLVHVPGSMYFRDYNYTDPTLDQEAIATSNLNLQNSDKYEIFDYPGRYPKVEIGRDLASVRIQQEEAEHDVVEGASSYPELEAGSKFKVKEHDVPEEVNQKFVLTRVEHVAKQDGAALKDRMEYVNRFECIPEAVTFRSPPLTPRPLVHGPQTAVVVGLSSEEIDTDEYASVKLAFYWDRETPEDENSSCWVRVAQSHAHKNWGGVSIPRIGQEVLVEFLEGNPDRPIVVGAVYNGENLPPWELPANKNSTGWKSRSTKDGKAEHYNELRFDDTKDAEMITFHAEKDFTRKVQHDDVLEVGEEDEGSQTVTIEKDQTITVTKGNREVNVKKGTDTYNVDEGNRLVNVKKGDDTYNIDKGNRELNVKTGNDTHNVKKGNRVVNVDKGNDTHNVKTGNSTVAVKMGNHSLTLNMGNQTTHAKLGKITLKAMQSIELKVGGSSVKVDMMGVTIKGMMFKAKGSLMSEVKGLMTTVKGDAILKAGGGLTMIG